MSAFLERRYVYVGARAVLWSSAMFTLGTAAQWWHEVQNVNAHPAAWRIALFWGPPIALGVAAWLTPRFGPESTARGVSE